MVIIEFLRARLRDDLDTARTIGNVLITTGPAGITPEEAERQAHTGVRRAELKQALFEETIRPYLGTAGPTGRIAEQQLLLFAAMYADHRDYRDEWRP